MTLIEAVSCAVHQLTQSRYGSDNAKNILIPDFACLPTESGQSNTIQENVMEHTPKIHTLNPQTNPNVHMPNQKQTILIYLITKYACTTEGTEEYF